MRSRDLPDVYLSPQLAALRAVPLVLFIHERSVASVPRKSEHFIDFTVFSRSQIPLGSEISSWSSPINVFGKQRCLCTQLLEKRQNLRPPPHQCPQQPVTQLAQWALHPHCRVRIFCWRVHTVLISRSHDSRGQHLESRAKDSSGSMQGQNHPPARQRAPNVARCHCAWIDS